MNAIIDNSHQIPEVSNPLVPETSRLVRGAETAYVEEIMPLVRHESVTLDLRQVERIDAAGIAALITLYRAARDAGRCFGVTNPTPHVREILMLVGLDRFLLPETQAQDGCPDAEFAQSAA